MFRPFKLPFAAPLAVFTIIGLLAYMCRLAVVPTAQAMSLPNGLPTHFSFGLEAGQGDTWMPQSGIGWDYRYQYLVGGANTNSGWETWNSPSGTFALNYATEGAQYGYIPMFPYYELLQSNGSCNTCAENERDISNLNSPSVMNAYYTNFALLMKRLGPGTYDNVKGFGKPALVNIEPDFAGGYAFQAVNNGTCFNFCSGSGNDPTLLNAAVAKSGYADVVQYPDTYAGYSQALAHLRDLYAPNVLLGYEVSPWATGIDIGVATSSTLDATGMGQRVGAFINKLGTHELLFNDPLDRDAGQYKVLFGQNRWWDRNNVTFPNFKRWEDYLAASIAADGQRSMLLWQVPNGNQYFDTVNNTKGHYQDNRPEYIFGHIPELIQTGIVGVMFGAGNADNTTYNDSTADGVTNPPSFCTSDGLSSGQICNNHVSTVADDDGGYIRLSAQNYYQSPVGLSGGVPPTSTAAPPSPTTPTSTSSATPTQTSGAAFTTAAVASPTRVVRGSAVSIASTVTSSRATTVLVDVEVYDAASNKVFQQAWDNQTFTAGQTRKYTSSWTVPATAAAGTYTISLGIFPPGWGTVESWNHSAGSLTVETAAPATSTATPTRTPAATSTPTPTPTTTSAHAFDAAATASPSSVQRGSRVTLTAAVTSAAAQHALVDVEMYDAAGARVFQQYWDNQAFTAGQRRTFAASWAVPAGAATGKYTVVVGVFSSGWGTVYTWNGNAATVTVS